jgi:hypothetical protein
MSLSSSIDRAVKAYIDHTNVVLAGDAALNVSYLTQPFNAIAMAQLALAHGGDMSAMLPMQAATEVEDTKGGKKTRKYKPRDPNAPKRPTTAYFRYLSEQRPALAAEMSKDRNGVTSKPGDLTLKATEQWNAMTPEQHQPYKDAYHEEMKEYEKRVAAYKASTGQAPEDAASPGAVEEEELIPGIVAAAAAKEDSETDSAESSDDDDDDNEDEAEDAKPVMAPPPLPKAPEPTKTPKSSMKKKDKAVVESSPAPTPKFASINPTAPVLPSSASPEASKKRKVPASDSTEEPSQKKRGRKTKVQKAAEEQAAADAKAVVPESDASSDKTAKKEKKKKSRKSEA